MIYKLKSKSSHPEVFLVRGVLNICNKFTGEHSCRSAISIKFQSNFIENRLWPGYSRLNFLHIFRTPKREVLKYSFFCLRESLILVRHSGVFIFLQF